MNPLQWNRIKDAFSLVVARGPDDVARAIRDVCGPDDELAGQVRPLVDEHFRLVHTTAASDERHTLSAGVLAGRFRIVAPLGSGTFGDVYRAHDEAAGTDVALKVLRVSEAIALEYFKREFRSLADIRHRNIVTLHDLVADGERWMLSMELVDGPNLLEFIASRPLDERDAALRACLRQLADGARALHERQLLHRDLKPSNVLVADGPRVVLLDFGLARPVDGDHRTLTFAGTPDYMSPEQAAGEQVREPGDWYAVGVMLYQALTGHLPFAGDLVSVLRRKQREVPARPADIAPSVPVDLNALCLKLLERDPRRRASYDDIARVVGTESVSAASHVSVGVFVGRRDACRRVADAYVEAEERPVLVHVCGPSGIGKTAFIRECIRQLQGAAMLIFAGRCYEGQSVPYQALDDVIDHIAQYLRRLTPEQRDMCLPRNFTLLARMFPVFAQFTRGDLKPTTSHDSAQLRIRALGSLREMLGRIAERYRVLVVIDDLQWGDEDGCAALRDLLTAADSPPLLALVAYRSEDVQAAPWLRTIRERGADGSLQQVLVELEPMTDSDLRGLSGILLGTAATPEAIGRIVADSAGSPFLAHEIAGWMGARGVREALERPFSFTDIVRSRVLDLSDDSRRLLDLIAVAGGPADIAVLRVAGHVGDVLTARDALIGARFVRSRVAQGREELDVYHDRIRRAITDGLPPASRRECHRALALALISAGTADAERVAEYLQHAGEPALCAKYALTAAARATELLAFNKAAHLFDVALRTDSLEGGARDRVLRAMADALARAGRGVDAGEAYLAAGARATVDEQLELRHAAAEQFLYSGHVDRGLTIFESLLNQVGMRLPKAYTRLPLELLARRCVLRMRGLRWRERDPATLPRDVLLMVDTCAAVAQGLALVDIARGAVLQTTNLLLALRAGDPARIARALAMEAGYRSTVGVRGQRRADRALAMARELSHRTGDTRAAGLTAVMAAACAWNAGRWDECYRRACDARLALLAEPQLAAWERDTASIFEVDGLRWMGHWSAMKAILPELLEDARARGDLYLESILQMHGGSCAALADDDPIRARDGLATLDRWSNSGFHVEHLVETHNQVEIALYVGDGPRALQVIAEQWPLLHGSLLMRVQTLRIQMRSIRGRAALCAAGGAPSSPARARLVQIASAESRAIRRERTVWGDALAAFLDGGVAYLAGHEAQAIAAFERAAAASAAAGMILHLAAARRAQGVLLGGTAGSQLTASAEQDFTVQAIKAPGRLASVIAPGLGG